MKKNSYRSDLKPLVQCDDHTSLSQLQLVRKTSVRLQDAANYLLAFRNFALENNFKFLGNLIKPTVTEIFRLQYDIDETYSPNVSEKTGSEVSVVLSARELECLRWCSLGKTYWETGTIIGITERTVVFHLASARKKLDSVTNAHCVAKAIRMGII